MRHKGIAAAVGLVLLSAAPAAAEVTLRLSAGMTSLFQNDLKNVSSLYLQQAEPETALASNRSFRLGPDLDGELFVSLGRQWGVGFGAGWIRASAGTSAGYTWEAYNFRESSDARLSVILLTVSLHGFVAIGRSFRADIFGGIGYYLASFRHERSIRSDFFSYEETDAFVAKSGTFGIQGGIGIVYPVGAHLALEGRIGGRYAEIPVLEGELDRTVRWFLGEKSQAASDAFAWYYEIRDSGKTYPLIAMSKDGPADPSVSVVRKARLILSGVSLSVGIRITL